MLSNIFQDILKKISDKTTIDDKILREILKYISEKPINSYVYPELIEERFNIDINECIKIFVLLEKKNILKQVYKLYCPKCKDFSEETFENINELEDQNVCEFCGKELLEEKNPYKYVVIYFRVIRNE
ncbi:hypothetical protein CF060_08445 [Clostridium botulinum]|uniref:hypothetical protein n=1 Tax=Clostridium botulinum TaxID=1491 RepID=UPI000C779F1F|nr:hypothetical protein [Clostridium botulinum]AUN00119.1 hypothetical protein RSJ13_14325 [Clostridium botulinum]QDY29936.1 hypothetical protein CGQ41_14405 [Clostridium botulinum]